MLRLQVPAGRRSEICKLPIRRCYRRVACLIGLHFQSRCKTQYLTACMAMATAARNLMRSESTSTMCTFYLQFLHSGITGCSLMHPA